MSGLISHSTGSEPKSEVAKEGNLARKTTHSALLEGGKGNLNRFPKGLVSFATHDGLNPQGLLLAGSCNRGPETFLVSKHTVGHRSCPAYGAEQDLGGKVITVGMPVWACPVLKGVPGTGVRTPVESTARPSIWATVNRAEYTNFPVRETATPPVQFEVAKGDPETCDKAPSEAMLIDEMSFEKVSVTNKNWPFGLSARPPLVDEVPL